MIAEVLSDNRQFKMVFIDDPPPAIGDPIPNCPCGNGQQMVGISHYGFDLDYVGFTLCNCGRRHNIVYPMGAKDWTGFELVDLPPLQVLRLS